MKTYKLPKLLTLDLKTWRCGKKKQGRSLGEGPTRLLNKKGKMCCLGQWSYQSKVPVDDLLDKVIPEEVGCITHLSDNFGHNTDFAYDCMLINDNPKTTVQEKIDLLRKQLKTIGRSLRVINKKVLND